MVLNLIPSRSYRSLGWSLAILAFAQLIISLDINIVFVALPEIGASLGFSEQTLQWVVSAYTVFCGGFLLLGGRAADLLGQRRMFIFALWLYALSSMVGGFAWNPTVIIVARAVQGIGGALLFPATLSLINRLFEEGAPRNKALAVWGGAGASGLTLGSLAGGVLTSSFGWPSVFFINVVLAGIAIVMAFIILPKDVLGYTKRRFDLPGALMVTAGATLLVYGLVQGPEYGWGSLGIVTSLVLSVIFLFSFILIEAYSEDPLMPLRLFRNRSLVAGLLLTFIYMGTFGALPYFETVLFQNVYGYTALQTGLAFIVPSLAIFTGTQLGGRLSTNFSSRTTLVFGSGIGIIGVIAMALATYVDAGYTVIVPGLIIAGLGQGIVWTAMWIVAASGVAHEEQGVASGMASTTLNVGNAIGLALLVALAKTNTLGLTDDVSQIALAASTEKAFYLAAIGMLLGLLVALALPKKVNPSGVVNATG